MPASLVQPVLVAREAMATRFEIVLHGENAVALRAAGEEALDEVERLEAQLSLYRPDTEIARVNALAHREAVRVSPPVFGLLQHARQLHRETGGAFDITIAPLMRCWGLMGERGRVPAPEALAQARAQVGMHLVHLDPANFTVRFERAGVMLDLGAIGKGYAVEKAAALLRELGVSSALIHGGTSTIYAIGHPHDQEVWKVALELPPGISPTPTQDRLEACPTLLAVVSLCDESLSVSAVWGKSFQAGGKTYGHILDPRTGTPAAAAIMAAVVLPSATETDALSTALLTLGLDGLSQITGLRAGLRTFVLQPAENGWLAEGQGIEPAPSAPLTWRAVKIPVENPALPT